RTPRRSYPPVRAPPDRRDRDSWRIDGSKEMVPAAQVAHTMLVPAVDDDGVGVFMVDLNADGVELRPVTTTNGEPHADVFLNGAVVSGRDQLNGNGAEMIESTHARALVGLCAIQLGVTERALRIAAAYTTEREQFGRPIGRFQAVQQRMADAFIDVEAIRWTMWQAAWLLGHGRRASREAGIAEFWAGEAGARVTGTRQQRPAGLGMHTPHSRSTRVPRHPPHLSPVPLLPMGQTQRADAGFGVRTVGPARRSVLTKETNDDREFSEVAHDDPGLAGHQRRRRGHAARDSCHGNRDRRGRDRIA